MVQSIKIEFNDGTVLTMAVENLKDLEGRLVNLSDDDIMPGDFYLLREKIKTLLSTIEKRAEDNAMKKIRRIGRSQDGKNGTHTFGEDKED